MSNKERRDSPEPFVRRANQTGKVSLNVLDVIELGGERVLDIDHDDFPVGLTLVEEGHDAKNLDLLHLTDITHLFADLANIEGIVVTLCFGLRMRLSGVLPRLVEGSAIRVPRVHRLNLPEGNSRSSRCIRGAGSSCGRSASDPF